ncbi:MAG: hypothetical protein M3305_07350 [Actinomycetota bacterium]|nr:hypothetical protein [Actinomycetota bacterium]
MAAYLRRAACATQAAIILFETGNDHLAGIEFDHGSQNRSADFRRLLPLLFR